jgi:hypothetical protein
MLAALLATSAMISVQSAAAQTPRITTFREMYGHDIGEDYFFASYVQLEAYWKKLASESDRMKLVDIGKTAFGRTQYMMIVSSPENLKNLDKYKDIASRLAKARGLTDEQAKALARDGKAVVWIDGGMHGNEPEPSQALMRQVYEAAASNDPEWMRILDDVIILYGQDNPDGQDLLAEWFMRNPVPEKRTYDMFFGPNKLPELPHRYVGHDNNRDFYSVSQKETENLSRIFFREWFPQIIYNQHQPGPAGAVVFTPPFRDPFNYHFDPLSMTQLGELGNGFQSRLNSEGKPGGASQEAQPYSTWYNGGQRTVSYFHNSIGILTEIIGSPVPEMLPLIPETQLAHNGVTNPIAPQMWHMKQSNDYSVSLTRSALDYASRNRERLLFNIYRMGMNSIEAGQRDSWTNTPKRIEALKEAGKQGGGPKFGGGAMGFGAALDPTLYNTVLHAPDKRDPRGYIIPADQADLPTAVRFLNSLIKSGVEVQRASTAFTVNGTSYPAGSFVVMSSQAYRPHVLDMFEPQDHPQDFAYPGGPPVEPYDVTGYTLAFQMGVKFDRVLDSFAGPFVPLAGEITPPSGVVTGTGKAGWLVSHATNNSFILTNRLMKAGAKAYWVNDKTTVGGADLGTGALWIPTSAAAKAVVEKGARELGLTAYAVDAAPAGAKTTLKPVRVAVVDIYGGLMTTGWTRWLFENFELPYTVVFPQRLNAGGLKKEFDVILMPDGAFNLPSPAGSPQIVAPKNNRGMDALLVAQPAASSIPDKYKPRLGFIDAEKTVPALAAFMREGGTAITIGGSTALASFVGLPVTNAALDDAGKPLSHAKFYIPGSLVTAEIDGASPIGYGLPPKVDLFFANSPIFHVGGDLKRVAWFKGKDEVHSGWAWHPEYLDGTTALVDANVGRGKLIMMGPEVAMRGQTHGAFKLLFNSLYYGPATAR